jgi:hypothetical protein
METDPAAILEQATCLAVWLGAALVIEKLLSQLCPYGAVIRTLVTIPLSVLLLAVVVLLFSTLLSL